MGYIQTEAAQAIGVSPSAIQKYERGDAKLPLLWALAIAAVAAGLRPYGGGPIATPNADMKPRGIEPARYELNGESLTVREWAERAGVSRQVLWQRLRRMTIEEALAMPVRGQASEDEVIE